MTAVEHKISKKQIDRAGKIFRDYQQGTTEFNEAVQILNAWRKQYIPIMDSYYDACINFAKELDKDHIFVAQRVKRMPTIIDKLKRFPHMHLSQMQDAGGVRVIVRDMAQLEQMDAKIRSMTELKSEKDYIAHPKPSGYRGRHYIFKKDGTLIEVQLRTALQHLWATSVETIDVFQGTSMKTALPGKDTNSYWQEFFNLVSSVFADNEDSPVLPQYQGMEIADLCAQLITLIRQEKIEDIIKTYATIDFNEEAYDAPDAYYAVVTLDGNDRHSMVKYYTEEDYGSAISLYMDDERLLRDEASVMVSVSSINQIRQIYPNYFMNLQEFMDIINDLLDTYR